MSSEQCHQQLTSLYSSDQQQPRILDTRPAAQYLQQRLAGAANIPLLGLTKQMYLLPDKNTPFAVVLPAAADSTIVTDQSLHNTVLQNGSTAVWVKGTASLQEFLSTRGWSAVSCYLQDSPELWEAAAQLSVLEQGAPTDLQSLQQRCLFSPSALLAASMQQIEGSLLAQLQQQQQQQQQQGCCAVLRALDVGCGSGRDVAWLASRQPGRSGAALQPPPPRDQQQQQNQQQQPPTSSCPAAAHWHVTGVDEWLGALERAADLAQALQLGPDRVGLAHAKLCPQTGTWMTLKVPAKSSLHTGTCLLQGVQQEAADADAAEGALGSVQYDLVLCCRFLVRAALPTLRDLVKPGGFVLYCTFLDLPGVRAFGRPSEPDHLLQPGELARQHFGPDQGFTVLRDDVELSIDGRELCWFVAQRVTQSI